jgi:large subunit ribosomal protein L9
MEVILLERIEKLGQIGEVVKVKPGYARNYLLPQKKALRATETNRARFEQQRHQIEANNLKRRQEAEAVSGKVDGMSVVLVRQAGENGQLFGSVSPRDIAEAVSAKGVTIERRQVVLDKPIKALGLFPVRVALHPEVIVTVTANVAKSEEEAEIQLKNGGYVGSTEARAASLDDLLADAEAQLPPEVKAQRDAEAAAAAEAEEEAE